MKHGNAKLKSKGRKELCTGRVGGKCLLLAEEPLTLGSLGHHVGWLAMMAPELRMKSGPARKGLCGDEAGKRHEGYASHLAVAY